MEIIRTQKHVSVKDYSGYLLLVPGSCILIPNFKYIKH